MRNVQDNFNLNKVRPNTHLLVSVYLTDVAITPPNFYRGQHSATVSKVDQFISTLHSMRNLQFATQDIYISYAPEYAWAENIVGNFLTLNFPNARLFEKRLETFDEWRLAAERISLNTELVLLQTNHDHVFVPENDTEFQKFSSDLLGFGDRFIGEITHWPESIGQPRLDWSVSNAASRKYFTSIVNNTVGTCLLPINFFRQWWKVDFTEGKRIVRPDNPFGPWVKFENCIRIVPHTEFFRHLDGYGHARVKAPVSAPLRGCCKVQGSKIEHIPWRRGNFFPTNKGFELPKLPEDGSYKKQREIFNLLLLSAAYRVNVISILRLLADQSRTSRVMSTLLLPSLLTNFHFLAKVINLCLPLPEGNVFFYKVRVHFAVTYKAVQKKWPSLPGSLRELLGFFIKPFRQKSI